MNTERFSPIALAVLALLHEEPMHPYRMQQLIKERGKDDVINVRQRTSLYQTIDRLLRTKLIVIQETAREEKWPERTIYAITEHGRSTMLGWMREMLATPAREFPAFPAVLAHLPLLTPDDARAQLGQRAQALAAEIERIDAEMRRGIELVPRLFLLESEYLRAVASTELRWVQTIVEELATGQLTWDKDWLRAIAAQFERRTQRQHE
ncbi:MAG: PadR family transcriptional regulator [Roseiflexaceae bacterium]